MKNIQQVTLTLLIAVSILISGCGPTGDKNSMDQENSGGEGAVDSTKIPNFDSSHAFLPVPRSLIHTDKYNTSDNQTLHLRKQRKNLLEM